MVGFANPYTNDRLVTTNSTVTLAVSPSSILENGTTNLVYTFTRTGATTNALTVNYSITGAADSSDYSGASPSTGKTITFLAGASTASLTIDPIADTTVEADETVAITLATGTGYTIGTTAAVTGTINNDEILGFLSGLRFNANGVGNIELGSVYSGSGIGNSLIAAFDYWQRYGSMIQIQGGADFIVLTQDSTSIDNQVTRTVLGGKFGYVDAALSSAIVTGIYSLQMKSDGKTDAYDEGFSAKLPGNGASISNPSNLSSWAAILDLEGTPAETGNYHGDDAGWTNFTTYASGKFFADGWEQTPFVKISGLTATSDYLPNVTDVNEAPTSVALNNTTISLAENTSTINRIKVADIAISDDAIGSNTISLQGADAGSFEVDGNSLYLKAGVLLDYEAKSAYAVTISVKDSTLAGSVPVTATFNLAVTDVNEVSNPVIDQVLVGSTGNDSTLPGQSTIPGFDGRLDRVFSGSGDDMIDVAIFGGGDNRIFSGSGADTIHAGSRDVITGGSGNDEIWATSGNGNRLSGNGGDDYFILGSSGNRALGGDGNDIFDILGGAGTNYLNGGSGKDTFWLMSEPGDQPASKQFVMDYKASEDLVGLRGLTFSALSFSQVGADTLLNVAGTAVGHFTNVTATSLNNQANFLFS